MPPALAFTVGTKEGAQEYWQGYFPDRRDASAELSSGNLLDLDALLQVMVSASLVPRVGSCGPMRVMTTLYESEFCADNVTNVTAAVQSLAKDHHTPDPRQLVTMVRELADNALYHSGRYQGRCRVGVIGAAEFAVEIRDWGVGIHHSMMRRYPGIDKASALAAAFGDNVSSESLCDPNRGLGLTMVLAHTETGANVLLESGNLAYVGNGGSGRLVSKRHAACGRRPSDSYDAHNSALIVLSGRVRPNPGLSVGVLAASALLAASHPLRAGGKVAELRVVRTRLRVGSAVLVIRSAHHSPMRSHRPAWAALPRPPVACPPTPKRPGRRSIPSGSALHAQAGMGKNP